MKFEELLRKHSVIGIAANRNQGKTMTALTQITNLLTRFPSMKIAVLGINEELRTPLTKLGVQFLESKMDILDLRMKDTLIFIDELAMLFDTQSKNKQLDKLMRFFDRLEHNNCKLIVATAREGYFNKFMCSRINAFIVKEIEYDSLVNGTWLKERVKAIKSNSDYRLELGKDECFFVASDSLTQRFKVRYLAFLDTKRENQDIFVKEKVTEKVNGKVK